MRLSLLICSALLSCLLAGCGSGPTGPVTAPDLAAPTAAPDMHRLNCAAPLLDCTDAPGCETRGDIDPNHCGDCNEKCPSSTATLTVICAVGRCIGACVQPWQECGMGPVIHCASNRLTDNTNCGGCGNACGTGSICVGGSCS